MSQQICVRCKKSTDHGMYCKTHRLELITELGLEEAMCKECKLYPPLDKAVGICHRCLNLCEYCMPPAIYLASEFANGCGKRMCKWCDDKYPKTRCLACKNWHRMPTGLCKDCIDILPSTLIANCPVLANPQCYGACSMQIKGYEAVCTCRYRNAFEQYLQDKEPEEP